MHPANKWLIGIASSALVSGALMWEGSKPVPYKDIGGVVTVCSGYTGKDIQLDRVYTKQECTGLLKKELAVHGQGVLECAKKPLKQNEYDAYTLFFYNVGVGAGCKSRALRLFNEGRNKEACEALAFSPLGEPAWSYVRGKYVQGLHNRRLFERAMCLGVLND